MELDQTRDEESTSKSAWSRAEIVEKVTAFEQKAAELSQRQWCEIHEVPRSSLQHWLARKENIESDLEIIAFFESLSGVSFLHRLMVSLHFIFTKVGVASSYNVSDFLELSGLSAFVGSSVTTQKRISRQMDQQLILFSQKETQQLAQRMPKKRITLGEDETFHPDICMVAMEPVSNFILVEQDTADRCGETWNQVVGSVLKSLPVTVIQASSDEARDCSITWKKA